MNEAGRAAARLPGGHVEGFADTFGAPRMVGTPFEHFHEGTDIFAPSGTPLHISAAVSPAQTFWC